MKSRRWPQRGPAFSEGRPSGPSQSSRSTCQRSRRQSVTMKAAVERRKELRWGKASGLAGGVWDERKGGKEMG